MADGTVLQPLTVQTGYRDYTRLTALGIGGTAQVQNANGVALSTGDIVGQILNTGAAQTGTTSFYDSSDGTNTNPIWTGILGANTPVTLNLSLKKGLRVVQTGVAQGADILVSHS